MMRPWRKMRKAMHQWKLRQMKIDMDSECRIVHPMQAGPE
jgi:hypothetical protein